MYGFAIYQAYVSVTESNTLFDIEQIRFLRVRAENMAIHDMEKLGVPSQNIVALPLENLDSQTHIIDTIHRVFFRAVKVRKLSR